MWPIFNSTFIKPSALYNACIAARLEPSPAEFRVGPSWPFQYGSIAKQFKNRCIYNSSISAEKIRADVASDPQITRIIVWETGSGRSWLGLNASADTGLEKPWVVKSDEHVVSYWYWDWTPELELHRREFVRQ